ncbi:MAG: GHMP kinase [Chloroflexi bacterium]|nr:GHMP kinase [Chloroflexota bacterium]
MIIVQAPLRVSLFGGGTDFRAFFFEEGGCALTTAIDKYIFVTIKQRFDNLVRVGYTKTEMVENIDNLQHELIREALRKTDIQGGIEITTMGDIPSAGSGLGSSSTVTVGALQACYTLLGEIITPEQLAREACEIELDVLKKPIGIQDQYIVAYGGLRLLHFLPTGHVAAEKIKIDPVSRRRLNDNLMLFFTGVTRSADTILAEQSRNIDEKLGVLRKIKDMAYVARHELVNGNVDAVGELLHEGWELKKQLAQRISNGVLDEMYAVARQAGAVGGKITGAGGGGFLLLYCLPENQEKVRSALSKLQELPFNLENDGSKVIFNYKRSE